MWGETLPSVLLSCFFLLQWICIYFRPMPLLPPATQPAAVLLFCPPQKLPGLYGIQSWMAERFSKTSGASLCRGLSTGCQSC